MRSIVELVKDNKKEAIDIINGKGGRIDFVNVIHGSTDDSEDDWNGNIDNVCVPMVLASYDIVRGFMTFCVLAVKVVGDDIEMLVYNAAMDEVIGWKNIKGCYFFTENYIYAYLANYDYSENISEK